MPAPARCSSRIGMWIRGRQSPSPPARGERDEGRAQDSPRQGTAALRSSTKLQGRASETSRYALTLILSWSARGDGVYPFYVRRFFRIAPMFWLAIPFYCVMNGLGSEYFAPDGLSWNQLLTTATFQHGWQPNTINAVVPGGWSIAVEMTFYAVFPLLALWINSRRRAAIALAISLLTMMIFNHFGRLAFSGEPDYLVSAFFILLVFQSGARLHCRYRRFFSLRDLHPPPKAVNLWLVLSLALIVLLSFPPLSAVPLNGHLKYALCFALFAFCLGRRTGGYLVNWPIRQLGKISYSCYLWHFAVLKWLDPLKALALNYGILGPWLYGLNLIGALTVTAALPILTYRTVERPMIALGKKLLRQRTFSQAVLAPALNV
ncbi:MAG: acyltransferase [Rhodomicrobium sp.]